MYPTNDPAAAIRIASDRIDERVAQASSVVPRRRPRSEWYGRGHPGPADLPARRRALGGSVRP